MSWDDDWNKLIRERIFTDSELKSLMLIPTTDLTNIVNFIEKYFVEAVVTDALVINENSRILMYETTGTAAGANPYIYAQYMHFDIYVKNQYIYGARENYTKRRDKLIFERLSAILLNGHQHIGPFRFYPAGDYALPPRCEGYHRYHFVLMYKKTS
jgi:hypothetical protein